MHKRLAFINAITRFLLYVKPAPDRIQILERIRLGALYAVCVCAIAGVAYNIFIDVRVDWISAATLIGAALIIVAGIVAFWITRNVRNAQILMTLGLFIVIAYIVADGGGQKGFGFFYLMVTFPVFYFVVGFRSGIILTVVFVLSVHIRMTFGNFPPASLYLVPGNVGRMITVLTIAGGLGIAASWCQHLMVKHLSRLAYTDEVTGLANRRKLGEYLEDTVLAAVRMQRSFGVVALKIQQFNHIHTNLGTRVSDEILHEAGQRFQTWASPGSLSGRWSGTLFMSVVTEAEYLQLEKRGRELLETVNEPFFQGEHSVNLQCAVIITRFPEDGVHSEKLIANVSGILDRIRDHHNKVFFFDEATFREEQQRFSLSTALGQAIQRKELYLVYHPKIELSTGRCQGAEILLRWMHPDLGLVSPVDFIPLAEQTGQIRALTRWVLAQAHDELLQISEHVGSSCFSSLIHAINLSPLDLRDPHFLLYLTTVFADSAIATRQIELEITEGLLLDKDPVAQNNLAALVKKGFRLAIDDFGTGYSSLSYLHELKVNNLKIDQSFIRKLQEVEEGRGSSLPIVDAIISMGQSLNLEITAEGVETGWQAEYLLKRGCTLAQGWLYSKPLRIEDYIPYLAGCRDTDTIVSK